MPNDKQVIVVTGCSGRIGTRVAKRFSDPRFVVCGLDIVKPHEAPDNFHYFHTDLTSQDSVDKTMELIRSKFGNQITSFIHLAAYYNFSGGRWDLYEKITVHGTLRLLQAAKEFDTKQFLFSSTMLVHAPSEPGQKIDENWPMCASWEYPRSKIETEEIMHRNHGDIPIVIMRIAGCYDDGCHSIPISNQIQRIFEKQLVAPLFPGDKTHGACFLHLDDLTEAIWRSVEKRAELPNEFTALVGEEDTMSYGDMQKEIGLLCNDTPCPVIRVPKWFAKFGAWMQNTLPFMPKTFIKPWMIDLADNHYELDLSHIEKTLGWKPERSVRKTLPIMIEKLKSDPVSWYKENGLEMPKSLKKRYEK